jgi:hypothetical protein
MIQRRKPIRRTAVKKKRTKPRPGRLKGDDLKELRLACWMRDGGICQKCGTRTLIDRPPEHPLSYHMAHRRGKRMWGDHIDQVDTQCGKCHRLEHSYGKDRIKPCPPKPKP